MRRALWAGAVRVALFLWIAVFAGSGCATGRAWQEEDDWRIDAIVRGASDPADRRAVEGLPALTPSPSSAEELGTTALRSGSLKRGKILRPEPPGRKPGGARRSRR